MSKTFYLRHSDYEVYSSGSVDTVFATNIETTLRDYTSGQYPQVLDTAPQSTGKTIVAGLFSLNSILPSAERKGICRLNFDGTEDTTFTTNTGSLKCSGTDGKFNVVKVMDDDKIILGGKGLTNGSSINPLVRLSANGSVDHVYSFTATEILDVGIQSDGKVIAVGSGLSKGVIRFLSTDSLDTSFDTNLGTGASNTKALAIQNDGKILIGGNFTTFNGNSRRGLVRLNSDGTEDTSFYSNFANTITSLEAEFLSIYVDISSIALDDDGKIILGGMTNWTGTTSEPNVGSIISKIVIRLNSDGTEDSSFRSTHGAGFTHPSGTIFYDIKVLFNDQILIGGRFSTFNSENYSNLLRLNSDGSLDTNFTYQSNLPVSSISYQFKRDDVNSNIFLGEYDSSGDVAGRITRLKAYEPRPYPYRIFTNNGPSELVNGDQLNTSIKMYLLTPKTLDSAGVTQTYLKSDPPFSLENIEIGSSSDLGGILSGTVTIKIENQPDSGRAILAKLSDWEDAGYTIDEYFLHAYEILFKLKDCIESTTTNNAHLHQNWVVLFLYNQGDAESFIVLVYQGNDPQAEEVVYIA